MKYYKGNIRCPNCGSIDNQHFNFTKEDIDLENKKIEVSVKCGNNSVLGNHMRRNGNCGRTYKQVKSITKQFYLVQKGVSNNEQVVI